MINPNNSNTPSSLTNLSVSLKITLVLIGASLATVLIAIVCTYFFFNNVQKTTVYENLTSLRSVLENSLTAHTAFLKTDALSLALSPVTAQIISIKALDTTDANAEASFEACHLSLTQHAKLKRYRSIYFCAPSGTVIYNSLDPKTPIPESSQLKQLCDEILKSKQPALITSPRTITRAEDTLDEPIFLVGVPILSGDRIAAILITENLLTPLKDILSFNNPPALNGLGSTGEAYLVDSNYTNMTPLKDSGVKKVETSAVRNALAGNSSAAEYENYAGISVLGSSSRLKIDGLPWVLVVEQSTSEALQPTRQATYLIAVIGLASIILIGIIGYLFAKLLAQPIINLKETILKVTSGDESARANVQADDEIGQLAQAVNEMIVERNAVKDRITTENKRVQANIQDFLLVVADASEGKLSVRAKRTEGLLGNVADALNRMLENVSALMGEAKSASAQVQESSGEIAASAQNLADGASSQTQQISQTILDVQNLAAEAQGVSENSLEAANAASQTRLAAEAGAKAVRDVVAYMERLQDSVQNNAQKITHLGERSQEISGIVRSISDISAETDVLAMNASIEAARAGEQGKGFTVVADQVRALADRTRQATIEIEKLVMGILSETAEAVKQMERANIEVENGTRQVSSAGESLGKIVEASVDSSTLANQISQSATQQEQRAQAMLQAIVAINQIAEDTRTRTLDFRETSDLLASLATDLNKQLANFDIGENARPSS